VSQVARHRQRLEEHLGNLYGRAAVDPDSLAQTTHDRRQFLEVGEGGRADRRTVGRWMHVHDIATDGDVDGGRNAEPVGRCEKTELAMAQIRLGNAAAHHLAHPFGSVGGLPSRGAEFASRFIDHSERSVVQAGRHVFRGFPQRRDLPIVDRPRAIEDQGVDHSPFHHIDQHRRQAHLDRVRAHGPDDEFPLLVCLGHRSGDVPQRAHGQNVRQSVEEFVQ